MDELVSVIIPNYNKGKYLVYCLDSVLEQTYYNKEIIVIDDHSDDDSCHIIEQYAARYAQIKPIMLKRNVGVSAARNIGVKRATGKYITMLDSDDFYINKKKLESEIALLKKNKDKGVAYSYRIFVNQDGNPFSRDRKEKRYYSGNVFFRMLIEPNAFGFVQRDYCLLRSELILAGGYDEKLSYYEDYDLLLRLAKNNPFYYTGVEGTGYRIISNGLSTSQRHNTGSPFLTPQKIKFKYIRELPFMKKIAAYTMWLFETIKLVARVIGKIEKRFLERLLSARK